MSFTIHEGETLGIVGESGCGKTMTALSLLRLVPKPAARIVSGEVILDGEDLVQISDREMREVRGRKISMILQDPQTSLNPVFTIGNQLAEALGAHGKSSRGEILRKAVEALRNVRVAARTEAGRFPASDERGHETKGDWSDRGFGVTQGHHRR